MAGRVIQGYFIGGAMRPQPAPRPAATANPRHPTGAPPPAFAGRSAPLQARMAPGRPPLAHQGAGHVAQPHGGNGSFEIDPVQLGLARGGGKPLPPAVLAKMEAAFGTDFSAVRVHVGPQASRIGAIAFTTGNDLYFAPGRYQPESVQGQQLIGHELAHVVQQRQGRVRSPSSGVAVVQDQLLEAEADRLGARAAMQGGTRSGAPAASLQRKAIGGFPPSTSARSNAGQPGRPPLAHPGSANGSPATPFGRSLQMSFENYGGGQSKKIFFVPSDWKKKVKKKSATKIAKMFSESPYVSVARSYDSQRVKQILRWIASLLFKNYSDCVEIQCYFHDGVIYVSSNKNSVNDKIWNDLESGFLKLLETSFKANFPSNMDDDFRKRIHDHGRKLFSQWYNDGQDDILGALESNAIIIPTKKHDVDLHAERRIQEYLGIQLDPNLLGGVKRACTVCAIDLKIAKEVSVGPFWPSKSALGGYDEEAIKKAMEDGKIYSRVTLSKRMTQKPKYTTDYDSDSDSDADEY